MATTILEELRPKVKRTFQAIENIIEQGGRGACWATEETLATQTGFTRVTISNHKRILRDLGLIEIDELPNGKRINPRHVIKLPAQTKSNPKLCPINKALNAGLWALDAWDLRGMGKLAVLDCYFESGLNPVACHWPKNFGGCSCRKGASCTSVGKHPVRSWLGKEYNYSSVKNYLKSHPDSNIGFIVSDFTVLDVDPRNGGAYSLEEIETGFGGLPETLKCRTGGGGWHFYYQGLSQVSSLGPGLDVKSSGTFVIAPPSRHASGDEYAWDLVCQPSSLPNFFADVERLDNEFFEFTDNPRWELSQNEIPQGYRNCALWRIGRSMHARGKTEKEILAGLSGINAAKCKPALGDREIATLASRCANHRDREGFRRQEINP